MACLARCWHIGGTRARFVSPSQGDSRRAGEWRGRTTGVESSASSDRSGARASSEATRACRRGAGTVDFYNHVPKLTCVVRQSTYTFDVALFVCILQLWGRRRRGCEAGHGRELGHGRGPGAGLVLGERARAGAAAAPRGPRRRPWPGSGAGGRLGRWLGARASRRRGARAPAVTGYELGPRRQTDGFLRDQP